MEYLVSILVLGATYALLAGGIVIVYKASRVVNFAHGELAIVGGYVFYTLSMLSSDGSLWIALAGSVASVSRSAWWFMSSLCDA